MKIPTIHSYKYHSTMKVNIPKSERVNLSYGRRREYKPHTFTCKECNILYTPLVASRDTYCSERCGTRAASRHHNYTRKQLIRTRSQGIVRRTDVFKRDKWTCKSCGVETPRAAMGLMIDNAPELDHIIPLSKGGTHTHANTQLLCRKCNNIKSDKLLTNEHV